MHKGRKKDNAKYGKIIQRLNCFNEIQLRASRDHIQQLLPSPTKEKRKGKKLRKLSRTLEALGLAGWKQV